MSNSVGQGWTGIGKCQIESSSSVVGHRILNLENPDANHMLLWLEQFRLLHFTQLCKKYL